MIVYSRAVFACVQFCIATSGLLIYRYMRRAQPQRTQPSDPIGIERSLLLLFLLLCSRRSIHVASGRGALDACGAAAACARSLYSPLRALLRVLCLWSDLQQLLRSSCVLCPVVLCVLRVLCVHVQNTRVSLQICTCNFRVCMICKIQYTLFVCVASAYISGDRLPLTPPPTPITNIIADRRESARRPLL